MDRIKVSIIIPIFNVEPYVERCLLSVYNQLYSNIEVILIDDCGTDNSISLAEQFIYDRNWNQARIIRHGQNQGLSASRNTGILNASGDYVYFLDSDDEISCDCIETLIKLAVKYQVDLVQGNYRAEPVGWCTINNMVGTYIPEYINNRQKLISIILERGTIPMMACFRLIKRQFILNHKLFFKEGIINEDEHWNFFLAKHLEAIAISKLPTYIYYKNNGSIVNGEKVNQLSYQSWKTIYNDWAENIGGIGKKAELRMLFSMVFNTYEETHCKDFDLLKSLNAIKGYKGSYFFLKLMHSLFTKEKISKNMYLKFVKLVFKIHKTILGV